MYPWEEIDAEQPLQIFSNGFPNYVSFQEAIEAIAPNKLIIIPKIITHTMVEVFALVRSDLSCISLK